MKKLTLFILVIFIVSCFMPVAAAQVETTEMERAVVSQVCTSIFTVTIPGYTPYGMPAFSQRVRVTYRVYYQYDTGEITEVRFTKMEPMSPTEHTGSGMTPPGAIVSQGQINSSSYTLSSNKRTINFNISGECYVRYYEVFQLKLGEHAEWQDCYLSASVTPNLS